MGEVKILSVNTSTKKGTAKQPVTSITLTMNGIEGDAHSGPWNRQVSLLGIESIRKFEQEAGRQINVGEFAENITTEGLELWKCLPLDRFVGDGFELEVTQIGKECHGTSCSIFKEVGNCVMPKEGIFARVIGSSQLAVGSLPDPGFPIPEQENRQPTTDNQQPTTHNLKPGTTLIYQPKIFSSRIITLSDRAFQGEYEDKSGPRIKELLEAHFSRHEATGMSHEASRLTSHVTLLPDDPELLRKEITESITAGVDFIFTTGGTGIGPRDFTPDVVKPMLDKKIPGIMEMIRTKYGAEKHQALLSRGIAGVAGTSLIFTLPGSVRAVNEYMAEILKSLMHMVYMLHGLDSH
jgi:molybdenum cofactor synthesis domain-containing protein